MTHHLPDANRSAAARRRLLLGLAAAPWALASGRVLATPSAGHTRLLVVFLRGAYDACNFLVPIASDFYYESRPSIAIPRPGQAGGALALDANWGLHPSMAASLGPLVERGQAAFIPFAGTDDLSRSHFETQDSIELGQPLQGRRDHGSGFLNRLAEVLGAPAPRTVAPIAFTSQVPMTLRGPARVDNIDLASAHQTVLAAAQASAIAAMYQGTALQAPMREGMALRSEVQRRIVGDLDAASRNAVTTKGFELLAQRMALLMRDRFDLGFIDVGGWDTHVNQGAGTGALASRLEELGRGLATFAAGMGDAAWRDTVVVVLSEFGRTFRENGNKGTDHGHGSTWWVLGGGLSAQAGGHVVGDQQALTAATLFQNRDWPVLNEYRAVLGGLFGRMYGLSPAQLQRVFADVQPRDLQLL